MNKEIVRLPGLVDAHVHLREPGATHKEDFETGTLAAVAGGFTTVLDMPNNPTPTVSEGALTEKMELARWRIYCDVGFYLGATAAGRGELGRLSEAVFGLKVYMNQTTGELLIDERRDLERIFMAWPRKRPILVHAEGKTLSLALELAEKYRQRLHVCHLATGEELLMVKRAKEAGLPVTCEVSAHHLFLTEEDARRMGALALMRPPLATLKDQQMLWENLAVIDMIASDHAPHTLEEKYAECPPYGVPGLETTLPLMLTAVAEGRLSLERLVELMATNPRKIFAISEAGETYTEVDEEQTYFIEGKRLKTKAGWTPFEGMKVRGRVKRVVLRGRPIWEEGEIVGPARGRVIQPK